MRPLAVGAGAEAPESAAECLVCERVQIYQVLVAEQRLVDDSVLQDTALHGSRVLVSTMKAYAIKNDIPSSAQSAPQSSLPSGHRQ